MVQTNQTMQSKLAKRHVVFKHRMAIQAGQMAMQYNLPIRAVKLVAHGDDQAMYVAPDCTTFDEFFSLGMYDANQLVATVQLTKNFTDTYQLNCTTLPAYRRQGRQRFLVAVAMLLLHRLDKSAVLDLLFTNQEFMTMFGDYTTEQVQHNRLLVCASANQDTALSLVAKWVQHRVVCITFTPKPATTTTTTTLTTTTTPSETTTLSTLTTSATTTASNHDNHNNN